MTLKNLLGKKKSATVAKWFERVLETYPLEVQAFFRQRGDRFANPVGSTIFESLDGLFEELLGQGDPEKTRTLLDSILRIRAIQNFSPSQGVVFLPLLKGVLRKKSARRFGSTGSMKNGGSWSRGSMIFCSSLLTFIWNAGRRSISSETGN